MAGDSAKPELRIGLVLYGGVSLAVYIYGVVEMQRLLRASRGYHEALQLAELSGVSIDVVAGTSAGGINGILLAKALACGGNVEDVRDLWVEQGDIAGLLHRVGDADPESLLSAGVMDRRLGDGFDRLEKGTEPPAKGALDLFVSATHLRGNPRQFRDSRGAGIDTLRHRFVFRLKRRPHYGWDDFSPRQHASAGADPNRRLVKLARATSAFPVAFEPVRIDAGDELLGPGDEPSAWFADGGILNNKPFTEALGAIFTRSADRPVRRWLFSVDPDPKPVAPAAPPGPKPAFDQIAVAAASGIPRYQSIAHDLESLEAHSAAVRRIAAAVLDLESDLAAEPSRTERTESSAYRRMRLRAWSEEIADWLMQAVRPGPESFDPEATRAACAAAALSALAGAEGGETTLEAIDLAFERRRAYYLIKLIAMAAGPSEGTAASVDLGARRLALWKAFDRASDILWRALASDALPLPPDVSGGGDAAFEPARERVAEVLSALVAERPAVTGEIASAVAGVVLRMPGAATADGPAADFSLALPSAFEGFEERDGFLLPIEAGGGILHRDLVDHAQISPATATSTGVPAAMKLAGDAVDHFGGFLDEDWRENDLLWGRLDAAEILIGTILEHADADLRERALETVQREILRKERPEALETASGDWRAYLLDRAIGDAGIRTLPRERIESIKARAGLVLRSMVGKAARDAEADPLTPRQNARRRVLVGLDRALSLAGRLLRPCVLVLRRRARKTEPSG